MNTFFLKIARPVDRLCARILPRPIYIRVHSTAVACLSPSPLGSMSIRAVFNRPTTLRVLKRLDTLAETVLPNASYLRIRHRFVRWLRAAQRPGRRSGGRREAMLARLGLLGRRAATVVHENRDAVGVPMGDYLRFDGERIPSDAELPDRLAREPEHCRLVMCCAFKGRHRLLRQVVSESLSGRNGSDVRWMLVGSTDQDFELIESLAQTTHRVSGFIAENRPLGAKWQAAVRYAGLQYRSDLLGITGSDDIVSNRLIASILDMHALDSEIERGGGTSTALYGTQEWMLVVVGDQMRQAPEIMQCNYSLSEGFEPLGAGRFYTTEFLKTQDYLIFDGHLNRCLDDRGFFAVRDSGRQTAFYTLSDGALVSVKGAWEQMNDLTGIIEAPQVTCREFSFEGRAVLETHLAGTTADYLFRTHRVAFQFLFSEPPSGIERTLATEQAHRSEAVHGTTVFEA